MSMRRLMLIAVVPFILSEEPRRSTWIQRSDVNTQLLQQALTRWHPETFDSVEPADSIYRPEEDVRHEHEVRRIRDHFRLRLVGEPDPNVRQDLETLVVAADRHLNLNTYWRTKGGMLLSPASIVEAGLSRALLQSASDTYSVAMARLERYSGRAKGYKPLAATAERLARSGVAVADTPRPSRKAVLRLLDSEAAALARLKSRLTRRIPAAGRESFAVLCAQLDRYREFLRRDLLPLCGDDEPEDYKWALMTQGVDADPIVLRREARLEYEETLLEMHTLGEEIAREAKWTNPAPAAVLQQLCAESVPVSDLVEHYRRRLRDVEGIIERERLVTLSVRNVLMEVGGTRPGYVPPPLLAHDGQLGTVVIPNSIPEAACRAVSWTVVAHEIRPGHEMQYAAALERGISKARALFGWSTVGVEGWAMYAESLVEPYMPKEGRLAALQFRCLRYARAFLEPGMANGSLSEDDARLLLTEELGLSAAMAAQEVDRLSRLTGEPAAYFYGFRELHRIRQETEARARRRFNRRVYHDFILQQGFVPLAVLRAAVARRFGE